MEVEEVVVVAAAAEGVEAVVEGAVEEVGAEEDKNVG